MEEMQGKASTECADLRHKLSESTRRITTLESALLDKDVVTTRMQDRIRGQGQEVLELTNKVIKLSLSVFCYNPLTLGTVWSPYKTLW